MAVFIELLTASFTIPMLINVNAIVWARPHATERGWSEVSFSGEGGDFYTFKVTYAELCDMLHVNG